MAERKSAEAKPGGLELSDYLRILLRRRYIIFGFVVLFAFGSYLRSSRQPKVFSSAAQVLLQPPSSSSILSLGGGATFDDPVRNMQTQMQVFTSQQVTKAARATLGYDSGASAQPIGATDVFSVTAEDRVPARAAAIANAWADAYITTRRSQTVADYLAAAKQVQAQVTDLQNQIDALNSQIAQSSGQQATVLQAQRDSLVGQQALLREKIETLQLSSSLETGGAQLVAPAEPDSAPISPKPRRSATLGAALGLLLGLAGAFMAEQLDDSIKTRSDLERAAPDIPILALIPTVPGWKNRRQSRLVSAEDPNGAVAEAYRSLRTSIQFAELERKLAVVQITSASASEGKTTTIANLGLSMARTGKSVIVVSTDLRRPRVSDYFDIDSSTGLTSVLLGDATVDSALCPYASEPQLTVLSAGPLPPNPSELLSSERMRGLIDSLRTRADVVLLDSPPVLPVTDAAVLSGVADAVVLVVTAGSTSRRALARALETLRQVDAVPIGLVLNRVSSQPLYGYRYDDYYFYRVAPFRRKKHLRSGAYDSYHTEGTGDLDAWRPAPAETAVASGAARPSNGASPPRHYADRDRTGRPARRRWLRWSRT